MVTETQIIKPVITEPKFSTSVVFDKYNCMKVIIKQTLVTQTFLILELLTASACLCYGFKWKRTSTGFEISNCETSQRWKMKQKY